MAVHQGKTAKPEPRRIRVNVPAADESVLEWFELQENHSLSVRQLIRESIERHGYVDVVNRPVAQLPKRGRPAGGEGEPPLSGADVHAAAAAAAAAFPPVPAVGPGADAVRAAEAFPPMPEDSLDLSSQEPEAPELLGIALQAPALAPPSRPKEKAPQVPVGPAPADPEPAPGAQQEVNDIFASLRR